MSVYFFSVGRPVAASVQAVDNLTGKAPRLFHDSSVITPERWIDGNVVKIAACAQLYKLFILIDSCLPAVSNCIK